MIGFLMAIENLNLKAWESQDAKMAARMVLNYSVRMVLNYSWRMVLNYSVKNRARSVLRMIARNVAKTH